MMLVCTGLLQPARRPAHDHIGVYLCTAVRLLFHCASSCFFSKCTASMSDSACRREGHVNVDDSKHAPAAANLPRRRRPAGAHGMVPFSDSKRAAGPHLRQRLARGARLAALCVQLLLVLGDLLLQRPQRRLAGGGGRARGAGAPWGACLRALPLPAFLPLVLRAGTQEGSYKNGSHTRTPLARSQSPPNTPDPPNQAPAAPQSGSPAAASPSRAAAPPPPPRAPRAWSP